MIDALPERSDEQIASATIPVVLGGQARRLPVLPIGPNTEWTDKFSAAIGTVMGDVPDIETIEDLLRLVAMATDQQIDLLMAYDQSGMLGGREYIVARATPGEVYETLKAVVSAAFPFVHDLATHAPQLRLILFEALSGTGRGTTKPSPLTTAGRPRRSKGS